MRISREKVELVMAEKGICTQAEISQLSGISRQTINGVLNGRGCRPFVAGKLAKALGVEVTDILE